MVGGAGFSGFGRWCWLERVGLVVLVGYTRLGVGVGWGRVGVGWIHEAGLVELVGYTRRLGWVVSRRLTKKGKKAKRQGVLKTI